MIRYYLGLRRDVSLLLSEGHRSARNYTIATVWSEAQMVRERLAGRRARETALMQMAIGSVFDSKVGNALEGLLKRMEQSE